MGSVVIPIQESKRDDVASEPKKSFRSYVASVGFVREGRSKYDMRKVIHSIKVGIALVLVSLLYLVDPLYNEVGKNAMWAIMTVVVLFEFFAGATLSKGINRGIGTILGGALGCIAAVLAQQIGGVGNSVLVGISIFIFGAAATYSRLIPSIKIRYDYGSMIFILTFTLVVVSGLRAEQVMDVARQRLATIGMGFGICIFTSLLVFPNWASDELHVSMATKLEHVASSIEGCLEEYFMSGSDKEKQGSNSCKNCKSVLHSKSKDEMLANFARWEPWHGKFGFSYPWNKYLQIGENLRELAVTVVSLRSCLESPRQPTKDLREPMREPCRAVVSTLSWALNELRESIMKMKKFQGGPEVLPKLKAVRVELTLLTAQVGALQKDEELAVVSFVFLLTEIVEKVEELGKEVEELGKLARFRAL
ncbi:aluminum-activated malate transporter 8-like [Punica granatum]|uniref:Aluminum-activated malate transporter 8-like n=1 Tax=Punica granatum TaxID=22663 RepID=A0A6P8E9R0_PUNGR|nr:aluminum-activated malate transporter 8-like [Punica granatum]